MRKYRRSASQRRQPVSNIDKRALREAAEKATPGNWWIDSHGHTMVSFVGNDVLEVFTTDNKRDAVRHEDTGNLSRWRNDNDATFIATANPATVLALLDELEAAEKLIAELEAREILLPERSSMLHRTDFHEDYQTVMAYKVSEVIDAISAVGIRIKGE